MKNGIQTYESTPLPDDTPKYAETAKRVRKHNRWVLLRVTCIVILSIFVIGWIGNYAAGARFSARSAAEQYLRKDGQQMLYATPDEYLNAGTPKLTYLGKVRADDGKTSIIYEILETKDGSLKFFCACGALRGWELYRFSMWKGRYLAVDAISDDNPAIYMTSIGPFYEPSGSDIISAAAFYSTDERVTKIELLLDDYPFTVTLNSSGFGAVSYSDNRLGYLDKQDHMKKDCKAMDADGNILYTLELVTENNWTHYEWIPVE